MKPLPFEPQSVETMRARFSKAIEDFIDRESVLLGSVTMPQFIRKHVFDFDDGMRVTVAMLPSWQTHDHKCLAITGYLGDEEAAQKSPLEVAGRLALAVEDISGLNCSPMYLVGCVRKAVAIIVPLCDWKEGHAEDGIQDR